MDRGTAGTGQLESPEARSDIYRVTPDDPEGFEDVYCQPAEVNRLHGVRFVLDALLTGGAGGSQFLQGKMFGNICGHSFIKYVLLHLQSRLPTPNSGVRGIAIFYDIYPIFCIGTPRHPYLELCQGNGIDL